MIHEFKKYYNYYLLILLSIILQSCSKTPGAHLPLKDKKLLNQPTEQAYQQELNEVAVYRINSQLNSKLRSLDPNRDDDLTKAHAAGFNTLSGAYQYLIGVGDVLQVMVWNHPELSQPTLGAGEKVGITVSANGKIYYPFVGNLHVVGKTTEQVRQELTNHLVQYFKEPQVTVNIGNFESKKIYVTGEVKVPGVQKITNIPLTVLDALNIAGGVSENAQWNKVILTRNKNHVPISLYHLLHEGDLKQNYLMKSGDVIHVPRNDKEKVFLMGEMLKPQTVIMGRYGTTLTEALSDAGGFNEQQADATGVFVIRAARAGLLPNTVISNPIADIYQLHMEDATALALGSEFDLRAGDIVYVTATPASRWNRIISSLMPTLSGVNTIKNIVD